VAATNRDLERAAAERAFRQDLLYRVNAIEIHVPPLRDREGDVARLAQAFLSREGSRSELSPRALLALASYGWPGNVRELLHAMQRLSALGLQRIDLEHLPRPIRASISNSNDSNARATASSAASAPAKASSPSGDEREEVRRALAEAGGNISRAAERLGITRHGLKKRMLRLGMRAPTTNPETNKNTRSSDGEVAETEPSPLHSKPSKRNDL
jgi:transcriptional regulator with GAF, ATPase, and Fis domain